MMTLSHTVLLMQKDLRVLLRARATLALVCMIGVLVVAVLSMAVEPTARARGNAPTLLWAAYLLAGLMCFEWTARVDRSGRAIDALRMSPAGPTALFTSKLLINLLLMVVTGIAITLAGIALLRLDTLENPLACAAVLALSLVGLGAIGTLFGGALSAGSVRAELLGVVVLPLALPLVLASTRFMERAAQGSPGLAQDLAMLAAFDTIYITMGWLAYRPLLET